jgi:hypothetical protein
MAGSEANSMRSVLYVVLPTFDAIRTLNDAGVRYVVVGGLATVLHGHARLTMDVDIVVALDTKNAEAAVNAIAEAGFRPTIPVTASDFANQQTREGWIAEKNMLVLNFKHKSDYFQSVDVFVKYPMNFEDLYRDSQMKQAYGTLIRVCSIDDLIRIKLEAGRPKDLEDVRMLEMIRESES